MIVAAALLAAVAAAAEPAAPPAGDWRPDPGTWTAQAALPAPVTRHRAVGVEQGILVTGGRDRKGALQAAVYAGALNGSGAVEKWVRQPDLPVALSDHGLCVVNGVAVLTGGLRAARSGELISDGVWTARPSRTGALSAWTPGAPLPAGVYGQAQVACRGRVYVLGGMSSGGYRQDVWSAAPGPDGRITAWTPSLPLPVPVAHAAAVAIDKYLVVLGGQTPGGGKTLVLPTVYVAPLNDDGSITTWYLVSSRLPGAWLGFGRSETSLVAAHNSLICFGGQDALWFLIDSVAVAPFDAGRGEVGNWAIASTGGGLHQTTQALVNKDFVYLVGGTLGGDATAKVLRGRLVASDRHDEAP